MAEVNFDPKTQYVVRNDQYCYAEGEQPDTKKLIEISFKDAAKSEKVQEKNDCGQIQTTRYYDKDGKIIGDVSVFNYKDADGKTGTATEIVTKDATYLDWNNDGKVDRKDTDKVYDKPKQTADEVSALSFSITTDANLNNHDNYLKLRGHGQREHFNCGHSHHNAAIAPQPPVPPEKTPDEIFLTDPSKFPELFGL